MIQQYIDTLTDEVLVKIIDDYEQFRKDGFIGDCTLRLVAEQLCERVGSVAVTIWMDRVAFEVYRKIALRSVSVIPSEKRKDKL